MTAVLGVRELGLQAYEPVWHAMQDFTNQRTADTADELWLVQHPPVFTQGQAGKAEHLLLPGDIPVVQVDRGGQVTYHGPGQIVVYPLLRLPRLGIGVRDYVCRIEQAIIDTLGDWNIEAVRREGAPGVYVAGAKIAAKAEGREPDYVPATSALGGGISTFRTIKKLIPKEEAMVTKRNGVVATWTRSVGDFRGAHELDAADAQAKANADAIEELLRALRRETDALEETIEAQRKKLEELRTVIQELIKRIPDDKLPQNAEGDEEDDENFLPPERQKPKSGKGDPKAALETNGFMMRRVVLSNKQVSRVGRNGGAKKGGEAVASE